MLGLVEMKIATHEKGFGTGIPIRVTVLKLDRMLPISNSRLAGMVKLGNVVPRNQALRSKAFRQYKIVVELRP